MSCVLSAESRTLNLLNECVAVVSSAYLKSIPVGHAKR